MLKKTIVVFFLLIPMISNTSNVNAQEIKTGLEILISSSGRYYWVFPDVVKKIGGKEKVLSSLLSSNAVYLENEDGKKALVAKMTSNTGLLVTQKGLVVGGSLQGITSAKRKIGFNPDFDMFSNPICNVIYSYSQGEDTQKKIYELNIYGAMKEVSDINFNRIRGVISKEASIAGQIYPSGSVYDNQAKDIIGYAKGCISAEIKNIPPESRIKSVRQKIQNNVRKQLN